MVPDTDLLRIENLHISFSLFGGRLDAVRGASLRVLPGKVTALVGESGSGKSVISQAAMGILPAAGRATGKILFDEGSGQPVDIVGLPPDGPRIRAIRGRQIGKIFQEPMTSLSPLHTIGDQIGEVLSIHEGASRAEMRERTEDMLAQVGFPNPSRNFDMYPFELSGGMRQRAMIAMALICRPSLLIADEPTTALDVTIQAQILLLLKDLQQKLGMAMLLITHDLGVVANLADEVTVIYHGQIVEAGPVDDIFRRPSHPYLKALMAAVPHFDMKQGERLKPLREISVNATDLLGSAYATKSRGPDVLLSVRGLSKSFSTRKSGFMRKSEGHVVKAVDNVNFDVRRGECLGLVGESGCGKTTVSKMLMRALSADEGSVTFNGRDGTIDVLNAQGNEFRTMRTKMQMVFQDPVSSLSPRMTVQSILCEPLEIHERGDKASQREMAAKLMDMIGLGRDALNRYPHSFSGGQRQRIGIARALALGPELLICDEPVSALDVSVQAQILNLLKDLQSELGLTYLFISHNLAVVDYMADRIAVMCGGRIVELAPREALMRAPVHPYTRTLLGAVPFPDLDRPLDFANLKRGGISEMKTWGKAFRQDEGEDGLVPLDLGDGHLVLARRNADARELRP
ncbi:Glutathione import ATP-binding protein GsiA [Hartmannibacter diazotrophicus]|uniref:Glutathione import ATP-binding protein GsiA n=1 Tax=Hartmannibacter diazotrophicus TaxID=1482074 RepID=A0A2C9DB35_9HYPH|nr:ABC transporter ATP-binding protein [Hartmannibacter diazotrophicus]SON57389.1 Glutathione import ATP-binding protein GsiA [Hartmannibacter diazotrophicus]